MLHLTNRITRLHARAEDARDSLAQDAKFLRQERDVALRSLAKSVEVVRGLHEVPVRAIPPRHFGRALRLFAPARTLSEFCCDSVSVSHPVPCVCVCVCVCMYVCVCVFVCVCVRAFVCAVGML